MRTDAASAPSSAASLATMADRCVQCGLCLPHCPTYRLDGIESESPRGRIAYIKAVALGALAPTTVGDLHLDHCLGCRRCEAVCPAGVEMDRLLVDARTAQFQRRALPRPIRFRLALLSLPRPMRAALALYRIAFGWLPSGLRPLPRPPRNVGLPPTSSQDEKVALFAGCVARIYESETRVALAKLLAATGVRATLPGNQGCCGTAAAHAGDSKQAERLRQSNRHAFAGHDRVLSLASGCQQDLTDGLAGIAKVEDAVAFLETRGDRLNFRSAAGRIVALHLPCTQRVLKSETALRRLLAKVPDLRVVELPDSGCCGAAGLHMLAEPGRAARLRSPVLAALEGCGASELLSANIGCRLHLANGSKIPVRHPIEFLAEHLS